MKCLSSIGFFTIIAIGIVLSLLWIYRTARLTCWYILQHAYLSFLHFFAPSYNFIYATDRAKLLATLTFGKGPPTPLALSRCHRNLKFFLIALMKAYFDRVPNIPPVSAKKNNSNNNKSSFYGGRESGSQFSDSDYSYHEAKLCYSGYSKPRSQAISQRDWSSIDTLALQNERL